MTLEKGKKSGASTEFVFDSIAGNFYYIYGQYLDDLETGLWVWKDTLQNKVKEIQFEQGLNNGYFAYYYPNGNMKIKGEGYVGADHQEVLIKDTLYFYNEGEAGKIDSLEIYREGRLVETIH